MLDSVPRPTLVVQHQDDAPPGLIEGWARDRGVSLAVVRPDRGEPLPTPRDFERAIVLGSDRSTFDPATWIAPERDWIVEADRAGLPILGICFGAQLLASALGGDSRRAGAKEVGWLDVRSAGAVERGPWLMWHRDVIELPPTARSLARNGFGPQAFAVGPHLGVQFHPEATPDIVAGWIAGTEKLEEAGVDPAALLAETERRADVAAENAARLFDAFVAGWL